MTRAALPPQTPQGYPKLPLPSASADAIQAAKNLHLYLKNTPTPQHTRQSFQTFETWFHTFQTNTPLILDSGCGTARSTRILARKFPNAAVLGIDRSSDRIARLPGPHARGDNQLPSNTLLLRAELAAFWRLLYTAGYSSSICQHYLLYPNPVPKARQRKRRWQFHPILPILVSLGGSIEVRSNWLSYLQEFESAVHGLANGSGVPLDVKEAALSKLPLQLTSLSLSTSSECLTRFEIKYFERGQGLYSLRSDLPTR